MQYRKLPIVIEAFKWTGGPAQPEDPMWIVDAIKAGTVRFDAEGTAECSMLIDTLEGTHRANLGDYVIQGIKGELYPCKPDIFESTYELASDFPEHVKGQARRDEVEPNQTASSASNPPTC